MKQIFFLAAWARNKERTWSGTTYSLYKALSKHFYVKNIDLSRSLACFFFRGLRKLGLVRNEIDMSLWSGRLKTSPIVKRHIRKTRENAVVFQFAEVLKDSPSVKTYIYQDLCVPFLWDMYRMQSEDYPFCGFQGLSEKVLQQRAKEQIEYYSSCSGIFTMGKWLKNYLSKKCGINASKIFAVGGGYKCR